MASQAPSAWPGAPPQSCPIRSSAARKWNIPELTSGPRVGMCTPCSASCLALRPNRSWRYVVPVLGAPTCTYTLRLMLGFCQSRPTPPPEPSAGVVRDENQAESRISPDVRRGLPRQGANHGGGAGAAEVAGEPGGGLDQCGEVDPVLDPETGQEPEQVLGGEVARRALGVGAAAEATGARVVRRDTGAQTGLDVGQRLAVGVVEVQGQVGHADAGLGERLDQG